MSYYPYNSGKKAGETLKNPRGLKSATMNDTFEPRGLYFENFQVDDTFISAGRTITEADIVNFAGLSGDFTPLHTDSEYARQGSFGQRVAHGLLGLVIASGLLVQRGFIEGTIQAFRELQWKFSKPILIGDTIHAKAVVMSCRALKRLGGGVVTLGVELINQHKMTVQSGRWMVLISSHPG